MRREVDTTGFEIVDLGDQPERDYILVWTNRAGKRLAIWVDNVQVLEGMIRGIVRIEDAYSPEGHQLYDPIVAFSKDTEWVLLDRKLIETMTFEQYSAESRANVPDRIRLNRLMEQAVQNAQKNPTLPESPDRSASEKPLFSELDEFEKWYRENKGDK